MQPRDVASDGAATIGGKKMTQIIPAPTDPTAKQVMRLIEVSGVVDFWDRPEEDIYAPTDGEPV